MIETLPCTARCCSAQLSNQTEYWLAVAGADSAGYLSWITGSSAGLGQKTELSVTKHYSPHNTSQTFSFCLDCLSVIHSYTLLRLGLSLSQINIFLSID